MITQVTSSWGSGVHSHDDSMFELEGQRGGPVVQVDAHTSILVTGLQEPWGLTLLWDINALYVKKKN